MKMFQINSHDLSPVSVIEWLGVASVLVYWRTSKAVGSVPEIGHWLAQIVTKSLKRFFFKS